MNAQGRARKSGLGSYFQGALDQGCWPSSQLGSDKETSMMFSRRRQLALDPHTLLLPLCSEPGRPGALRCQIPPPCR